MDAPGSRILLRPGGLGRGGRSAAAFPGMAAFRGSSPLDDPGLVPISDPGSRSRTPAASGSSWPEFPRLAPCVMTGDQFRRQDDGPVWHAPADGGASAMAIRKTLSTCMRVRSDWVRSVRLCEGHFPGSRIGGTALRNLHAAPLIGGDSG